VNILCTYYKRNILVTQCSEVARNVESMTSHTVFMTTLITNIQFQYTEENFSKETKYWWTFITQEQLLHFQDINLSWKGKLQSRWTTPLPPIPETVFLWYRTNNHSNVLQIKSFFLSFFFLSSCNIKLYEATNFYLLLLVWHKICICFVCVIFSNNKITASSGGNLLLWRTVIKLWTHQILEVSHFQKNHNEIFKHKMNILQMRIINRFHAEFQKKNVLLFIFAS
jgi:hypothetical protein